ncbi:hypothetical protein L6164_006639 [Bauhinia variegata]|uniref:Uncharacterized protein n=1 Tax=Bauhinia variegata TaxID=167791 RepID=A0ACB9PXS0_BAUVA|nr:hypothetical protein L6164_006639 [Bauhinia variegata]
MYVMIPRNHTFPTKKAKVLTEPKDYQTLKAFEGENNLLGNLCLSDILPNDQIKVCFDIDANGISNFSAVETSSGKLITVMDENRRLSKEEIERLIEEVQKLNAEDEEFKEKVKAKNDLEDYAYKARKDIINKKLFPEDKKKMLDTIEETIQWLDANEHAEAVAYRYRKEEIQRLLNREKQIRADDVDGDGSSSVGAFSIKEVKIEAHSQLDSAPSGPIIFPNNEIMAKKEYCASQDTPYCFGEKRQSKQLWEFLMEPL